MLNKIRKWLNWKRRWSIYGWVQMCLWALFFTVGDFPLAYVSAIAAMAFFGIAECKKEDEKGK